MALTERIKGRLVEIEIGETKGLGWVAVGVVKEGFPHEEGLSFEAKASDPLSAEATLKAEIEAYFNNS
jgi:hypothetical protein